MSICLLSVDNNLLPVYNCIRKLHFSCSENYILVSAEISACTDVVRLRLQTYLVFCTCGPFCEVVGEIANDHLIVQRLVVSAVLGLHRDL